MIIFFEDTEIARSILAMIASYSTSLLEARKSKRMVGSITSPIEALSYSPSPTSICLKEPSTFRIHQPELSGSISCGEISAKRSASTCPFNAKRGLY